MKGVARADSQRAADYEAAVLAFSRLSHAVTGDHDASGALSAAAETGAVLLQADSGAAFLLNATSNAVELAATYRATPPAEAKPVPGETIARRCIETGLPAAAPNVQSDRRRGMRALAKLGAASALCVPLEVGQHRLGALMVMSGTLRAFSASDIEVLAVVAAQAALAVWKSQLCPDLVPSSAEGRAATSDVELLDLASRKIWELAIVGKVSEAVISTLDLKELLKLALEQCLVAVGAGVGSIMLLDEESGLLTIKAAKGLPADVVESASVAVGEGIAGWVAANGQPVLVGDARSDPRFHMQRYRDDITSAMSIALKARGRVIGVLNASTVDPGRRYGPREVEFLSTIANQVAMALDNARLYEGLERRSTELASLLQVSEAITSTLDLTTVVELLAERFTAMVKADACVVLAYDSDSGRFRCLDGRGLSAKRGKSRYIELARPLAMRALEEGRPVWGETGPGTRCYSEAAAAEGLASGICVPLCAAGRVIGAVALLSKAKRSPSSRQLSSLVALGGLAGVALQNALIYKHKHDIARSLQSQLVPTVPLAAEGVEIGHRFLPAREVGGDYYDLVKVSPGRIGIVIADVAGSSVRAAMHTTMGKHVLRAYALENDSPADVLRKLNRIVHEQTHPEVFISLFYGVFDSASRTFRYACAGHEPPLLYRPDGSFDRLQAGGLLVGISPEADFEQKEVRLDKGSIVVLFTDGLVEAPSIRRKFGIEQIKEIVAASALKPAQEVADNIYARVTGIVGSRMQDDVALVVLKAQ